MLKLITYFLLFFGVIFFFLFLKLGLLLLGLWLLIVVIFISSKDPEITERWSALIRNAQGNGDWILSATKTLVEATKAPSIEMNEENVNPSLTKTAFGETRKFLIIIDRRGLKLASFKIFVNAVDYGNNLFVGWYLAYKPDWWQTFLLLMPGAKEAFNPKELNLFDEQDLTSFVTTVHECFKRAVDKLLLELHQDPSKLDRRSRGFLGIS